MAVYAIGDIQGCFDALQLLLDTVGFSPSRDTLWFAGDLVNRGDKSLETLRFVRDLGASSVCVLGNHDLSLLALAEGHTKASNHTMQDVLAAPDREDLFAWLRRLPLLHHDGELGFTLVHAGLPPQWDLETAARCAREVEEVLRDEGSCRAFLAEMFGNKPKKWDPDLKGADRYRFIINCLTRMRYCTPEGRLNFADKGPVGTQKKGYLPWFAVPERRSRGEKIIFGHWSSLDGETGVPGVFALDTGCLWGGRLSALRLDFPPEIIEIGCEQICSDPGPKKNLDP